MASNPTEFTNKPQVIHAFNNQDAASNTVITSSPPQNFQPMIVTSQSSPSTSSK